MLAPPIKKFWATVFLVASLFVGLTAWAPRPERDERIQVPIEQSPSLGSVDAPITIIEFTDFQCPFCKMVQSELKKVKQHYPGKVRIVFKNFPLQIHQKARQAHLAALCADEQGKFWGYRDVLFDNQKTFGRDQFIRHAEALGLNRKPFEKCLDLETYASRIDEDIQQALAAGIGGVPAFLINGRLLLGAHSFASFRRVIDQELS